MRCREVFWSGITGLCTYSLGNEIFRRGRFRDEHPQGLRRILEQLRADRPFSVDEPSERSFIDAKSPRSGSCAAEYLDAMGKMSGQVRLR